MEPTTENQVTFDEFKQDHITGLKNFSNRVTKVKTEADFHLLLMEAEDYISNPDDLLEDLKLSFINHLTRQIELAK